MCGRGGGAGEGRGAPALVALDEGLTLLDLLVEIHELGGHGSGLHHRARFDVRALLAEAQRRDRLDGVPRLRRRSHHDRPRPPAEHLRQQLR